MTNNRSREGFENWRCAFDVGARSNAAALRDKLASESMVEKIAELQANGWDYGIHPKDKARIVLAAILKEME